MQGIKSQIKENEAETFKRSFLLLIFHLELGKVSQNFSIGTLAGTVSVFTTTVPKTDQSYFWYEKQLSIELSLFHAESTSLMKFSIDLSLAFDTFNKVSTIILHKWKTS